MQSRSDGREAGGVVSGSVSMPTVEVDSAGLATHGHIAAGHVRSIPGGGELTLCGKIIAYSTWLGTVKDAPMCHECEENDG